MTRFRRQLLVGGFLLALASALAVMVHGRFQRALPNYAYLTGWVLFSAIALLAVWVWRSGQQSGRANWAQDWVPGIGTSAMTILITVAVVDRILGRRERLQRQRRLRSIVGDGFVNYGIYGAWQTHLNAVAGDYAEGHLNSYQRPRRDTLGLLRDWLDGQAAEDVPLRTVQRLIKSQAIDF